jgi:diguanylate cyclase (GGDEF)-like protein
MLNVARFSAVLIVFVASVAGVVWTTASAERRTGAREFEKRQAAEAMLDALLARESALRGYSESGGEGFLQPYDEATASLAAAADRARRLAGEGDTDEKAAIAEQERLAERWVGIANDTVIRVRNGRAIPAESTAARNGLVERFERANDDLLDLIADESADAHAGVVERAVAMIVLLSAAFAATGAFLLARMRRREADRQVSEAEYYSSQREFAETLQVTGTEGEAHALLKRHLERSLADSEIVVLNRNNSQNRLEAATPVNPASALGRTLVDSSPNSCLAVRLGRAHAQSVDNEPLLTCDLCGGHERTTCVPSLVGGEVIGSVLVAHPRPLTQPERSRVDESVSQAAPVLANLRNLAVAEVRAATDALTGLPNARSLRESLVRMVAQAARSELPLSAVLCDLDHFKQINDVYGHEKGDQALAAASAALRSALRESDLVGRYGGEEFLILLPDTPLDGAVVLAQKLREEVALVAVPGVDRAITASFGVASFPADTPDGDMLIRMADRALYAAKSLGRNCVVTAAELLVEQAPAV